MLILTGGYLYWYMVVRLLLCFLIVVLVIGLLLFIFIGFNVVFIC